MLCPSCHTENRENARFCKGCGRPLTAAQAQPQAESVRPSAVATTTATAEAVLPQSASPVPSPTPIEVEATIPETVHAEAVATEGQQVQTQAQEPGTANGSDAAIEDITQAPTLVLTPEEMASYRSRHWSEVAQTVDIEDQPTASIPGDAINAALAEPASDEAEEAERDASRSKEVGEAAHEEGEITHAQDEAAHQDRTVAPGEHEEIEEEIAPESVSQELETVAQPAEETEAQESQSVFPTLPVGTTVNGRYEVLQLVNSEEHEHVYQVVDRQGYQRCWNCGSEQNAEGDEFCIDCGAELLNIEYTMHEYDATSTGDDAHVLLGQIINTFVEQGHTYVIEQPQISQPLFPNGVHLLAATDSDAGLMRRGDPNEDSTLLLQLQRVHESISSPVGVFIVADGMGGHDDGQGASRMTINVIAERLTRALLMEPLAAEKAGEPPKTLSEDELVETLKGAIQDANLALCQDNQRNKTDKGSTVTGFMIVGEHAYIINVGDSRTYMLRDGKLYQLTNDHSLVSQLVASGLIEPDDIYTHPQRSQIFRSLGDKPNVQIDDFKQQLHPGDILLSCCDGLWEMVRNPQITEILMNAPDPQTACTRLIEAANANGGEDNISAVVVFVRG